MVVDEGEGNAQRATDSPLRGQSWWGLVGMAVADIEIHNPLLEVRGVRIKQYRRAAQRTRKEARKVEEMMPVQAGAKG
jgi:hypothetical protein